MEPTTTSRRRRRLTRWQLTAVRLFAVGLVLFSLVTMVLSRVRPELVEPVRTASQQALAPMLSVAAFPVRMARATVDWVDSYLSVRERNLRLEDKLSEQEALKRTITRLEIENARLRGQLKVTDWPIEIHGTARVIGAGGGPFVRSVLVDAGSSRNVSADMAVVDNAGVVGRIISVGPAVSRVLLLTDLNSRIPVRIASSDETAILAGTNTDYPELRFLPIDSRVERGDLVFTSAHGGVFPPDLPVGVVVAAGDGPIKVRPFARLDRLRFLSVVSLPSPPPAEAAPLPNASLSRGGEVPG